MSDEKLIEHIVKKAMDDKTPLTEAVEALKAVTGYRTMQNKRPGKSDEDDSDEPDFGKFKDAINGRPSRKSA